jgi:VWFA-related protein
MSGGVPRLLLRQQWPRIVHRGDSWQHQTIDREGIGGGVMRKAIIYTGFLAVLILTLMFPRGEMQANAAAHPQQQGQQQEQKQQPRPGAPGNTQITVSSQLVNVDAVVTDDDGGFLTGLKKQNFRILEDGKPQIITNFTPSGEAPITIVILLEFRANMETGNFLAMVARYWAPEFLRNVKPNDWIALKDFDLKTTLDVDFTHDPQEIMRELYHMQVPLYSEANLFDAVLETLDQLQDVQGKKAILLIATGQDTFSKHTLDNTLKRLRQSDVSIYCIGLTQFFINTVSGLANVNTLQMQNQLRAFSELTGGNAWNPNMEGEVPGIMRTIALSLRNQYSLGYVPQASSLDGKYHKIKVELTMNDGTPFVFTDPKGKKKKFVVYARQGFTASKPVVGN